MAHAAAHRPEPAAAADPAPALTRGLTLLRVLQQEGACSLEHLARLTGWPKSSLLRLLQSLEGSGAVQRDRQTKRYRALVHLVPATSPGEMLTSLWTPVADRLAADTGQTVELHRFAAGQLTMIDRCEPETAVVSVKARIGFQRNFDEFDALTQVVFAFGFPPRRLPKVGLWIYDAAGRRARLAATRVQRVLAEVRRERVAIDLSINNNAVRRYAAPVLDPAGQLLAVLALAQVCVPGTDRPDDRLTRQVHAAAHDLTHRLAEVAAHAVSAP